MTAEIAVLNKDAVALAADSTVTVSGKKTYHTTNKLFALSAYHPVGVMVYGSAEFAGIPWETLIKLYRRNLDKRYFKTLSGYKDDFISFLEKGIKQFDEDEYGEMISEYAEDYLEVLRDEVDSEIEEIIDNGKEISDKEIQELLRKKIRIHEKKWNDREKLKFATTEDISQLKKKHKNEIYELIKEKLEEHPITTMYKNKIVNISVNIFCSQLTLISGVVFAGFGEDDIFPKLFSCRIECMVSKKIKHTVDSMEITNQPKNPAAIVPFAQVDVVGTFMEGMSRRVFGQVLSGLEHAISEYTEKFVHSLKSKKVPENKIDSACSEMVEVRKSVHEKLKEYIERIRYENHVLPVLDAVQFLPKNEMAEVAESLVSITSFKQKISLEQESVGGAIDVAVISKSDGFVWIRRKHYFEADLNPMFFAKYLHQNKGDS